MGTKAMLGVVIGLGLLIAAGLIVVVTTLAHRMVSPDPIPAASDVTLDEPPGTRVGGLVAVGDRLAVLLQGGGADRIVLLDARAGNRVGSIAISGPAARVAVPAR